ncbi:DUF4339 domain-containing protein [Kaistia soli]|uniref:DUF4339 domain-containing protein n=1 Tax=Kaistia soli TaxID=446684 RepID=UPI001FCDD0D2|nr:GYF domain-containing protein [Kaistia soli]
MDGEWYVHAEGQTYGPFTGHELADFVRDGRLTPTTDVVRVGSEDWTAASEDKVLVRLFPPATRPQTARDLPPERGPVTAASGATVVQVTNTFAAPEQPRPVVLHAGDAKPKSAGTALVLSILIVGAGQMYNGQVGKGFGMLILCVALWFVALGWIINIWSWIDAYKTAKAMNERYIRLVAAGAII